MDKTENILITRDSTRMKLVPNERYDFCDGLRTKLASNRAFISILWPLKNYFENNFCRQICGELKVLYFSNSD